MSVSLDKVIIGPDLDIRDLSHFVNEYLMKTEPNNYNQSTRATNITVTNDTVNNRILITEQPRRTRVNEPPINKQLNTTLNLNNFELSISDIGNPTVNNEVLAFGNYKDPELENICNNINEIIINDTEIDTNAHENLVMDYIISYDNTGTKFDIFPLSRVQYINSSSDRFKDRKKTAVDNIKSMLTFFINKHTDYLRTTPELLKNKLFLYKLTSPYQASYILRKMFATLGESVDRQGIGMQTEGAHMDSCNLGDDEYVDDEYCEISSIIYTNVRNNSAPKINYYASAAFFYAPEFPMPVQAEKMEHMGLSKRDSFIQKFQEEYKRLFVSAPMTSTGWAIWKNKPKRNIKNITGNRFNLHRADCFNIPPIYDKKKHTHFSAINDEFVYHASPYKALQNYTDLKSQRNEICNWAPSSSCSNEIERFNFTIRRANYNLFRFFRDIFEYDNDRVFSIAYSVINSLSSLFNIYNDINSEDCKKLVGDINKLTTLNSIRNLMNQILKLTENKHLPRPDTNLLEKRKFASKTFYEIFKTNETKYTSSVDSITMLNNYLNQLYIGISSEKNIDKFYNKYGVDILTKPIPLEQYRTQIGGDYKLKYLKYKQKYLELKKSIY